MYPFSVSTSENKKKITRFFPCPGMFYNLSTINMIGLKAENVGNP